jgi:hypothetical protein
VDELVDLEDGNRPFARNLCAAKAHAFEQILKFDRIII